MEASQDGTWQGTFGLFSIVPLNEIMGLFLFPFSLWLPAMREHLFDWELLNITGTCCKPKPMGTTNHE